MPSVVLISPIGTEITVTSSLAFNQYVYGGGYRPKTGTVEANFAALQDGTTPVPDLTRHISLADLEDDDSDASAVLRAALEPHIPRAGAAAGQVPVLQSDGSLALTGVANVGLSSGAAAGIAAGMTLVFGG